MFMTGSSNRSVGVQCACANRWMVSLRSPCLSCARGGHITKVFCTVELVKRLVGLCLSQSIRVKLVQNTSAVERRFSSWIGGSILGSLVSRVDTSRNILIFN